MALAHALDRLILLDVVTELLAVEVVPPLCVIDDFPYLTEHHQLRPGDILVLATDGATEAMDAGGALMGHDRIAATLATLPPDASAADAVALLQAAVAAFVKDAEPSDDLTLLGVRWRGPVTPLPAKAGEESFTAP